MRAGGVLGAHVDIAASKATSPAAAARAPGASSSSSSSSSSAPNFERAKDRAREAVARVQRKSSVGMTGTSRPTGGGRPLFSFLSGPDKDKEHGDDHESRGLLD